MKRHNSAKLPVTIQTVGLRSDRKSKNPPKVEIEFSFEPGEGRAPMLPVPVGFDIWSSSDTEVMKWLFSGELTSDNPAVAQWAAAQYLLSKKEKIQLEGLALLEAVTVVARSGLVMPDWMAEAYIERFRKIQRMEIGSLDDAFGPLPFKPGMRLDGLRRRRSLIVKINRALVEALNNDPRKPIDGGLFEEIGKLPDIAQSGSFVEKAYYEGVREHGMQDIKMMKDLLLFPFK